jgi:hypothetical protein
LQGGGTNQDGKSKKSKMDWQKRYEFFLTPAAETFAGYF